MKVHRSFTSKKNLEKSLNSSKMSSEFWKQFKRSDWDDFVFERSQLSSLSKAVALESTNSAPPDGYTKESSQLMIWMLLIFLGILLIASIIKIFLAYNYKEIEDDMEDGLLPSLDGHASINQTYLINEKSS
jgi:hypothetical protein